MATIRPGDCPTAEALARTLLEPSGLLTRHVSRCSRCSEELAEITRIIAVLGDEPEAIFVGSSQVNVEPSDHALQLDHRVELPDTLRNWRRWVAVASLGISMLLGAVGLYSGLEEIPSRTAGRVRGEGSPLVATASWTTGRGLIIEWHAVAGANRYSVSLWTGSGRLLKRVSTNSTRMTLTAASPSDPVALESDRGLLGVIDAWSGATRLATSELLWIRKEAE